MAALKHYDVQCAAMVEVNRRKPDGHWAPSYPLTFVSVVKPIFSAALLSSRIILFDINLEGYKIMKRLEVSI